MDRIQPVRYVPVDFKNLNKLSISHPHPETKKSLSTTGWPAASVLFTAAMLSYVLAGVACVLTPPRASEVAGGKDIPSSAKCLRATRHADYATVDISVGTPATHVALLLRLDSVLLANSTTPGMRLFSQGTAESRTVNCDLQGECEDVVMISEGANGPFKTYVARFGYRHSAVESSLYTTASYLTDVKGEMFLRQGNAYWLTATHLCYAEAPDTQFSFGMVEASINSQGYMVAERNALLANDDTRSAPAASSEYNDLCINSNSSSVVSLFPVGAAREASWLTIVDNELYNREPESVDERRAISEIGTTCAESISSLSRALTLYKLDCIPYSACSNSPNMPFRRVARTSMYINIDSTGRIGIWTEETKTLQWLPQLSNSTTAFLLSLSKLLLITLAAAVVYVRSKRFTASSSWLFKHCIDTATTCGQAPSDDLFSVFEDASIGLLAFTARLVITIYRINYALLDDDQARVCYSEVAVSFLSIIHWMFRYLGLEQGSDETPVSKLGGATAIMDSSAAVMMSFSESPTLVVSIGRFDPTARLLVALLLSTIVVSRCAFSASCCGVLWESETCPERQGYAGILLFSGISWVLQSAALAVLMSDLFVTPSAYSMSRNIPGDGLPARMLLFLALTCVGLPRLMRTLRHIISPRKDHVD